MNKKLSALFTERYGLTVDKNTAYGKIRDYEVNAAVSTMDTAYPVRLFISFYATDEQKRSMDAAIGNLALKSFKSAFSRYGLTLGFNGFTMGQLLKRLPDALDKIFDIVAENGAMTSAYCPVCGKPLEEGTSKKCNIEGATVTIDNECVETINKEISAENKDFDDAPNNYLKGFIGALIGGLAGAAISVLLNFLGIVSAISAVVAVILGAFLYQKFHGKPNKMMILIVSVTTLVLMLATIPIIYITSAAIAANEVNANLTAIEAFMFCMEDAEFAAMFYTDLALVFIFTALGIGFEVYTLSKKIKRKNNI